MFDRNEPSWALPERSWEVSGKSRRGPRAVLGGLGRAILSKTKIMQHNKNVIRCDLEPSWDALGKLLGRSGGLVSRALQGIAGYCRGLAIPCNTLQSPCKDPAKTPANPCKDPCKDPCNTLQWPCNPLQCQTPAKTLQYPAMALQCPANSSPPSSPFSSWAQEHPRAAREGPKRRLFVPRRGYNNRCSPLFCSIASKMAARDLPDLPEEPHKGSKTSPKEPQKCPGGAPREPPPPSHRILLGCALHCIHMFERAHACTRARPRG